MIKLKKRFTNLVLIIIKLNRFADFVFIINKEAKAIYQFRFNNNKEAKTIYQFRFDYDKAKAID
jgi:hypothetical protein